MRTLTSYAARLPLAALLLTLLTTISSCSGTRMNDDGSTSLTAAGILYLILAIAAVVSLLKQDWSLGKKLIWGAVIWFAPFVGSIIYFLFSGRK